MLQIIALALFLIALVGCSDSPTKSDAEGRANIGIRKSSAGIPAESLQVASVNMSVGWNAEDLILKNLNDSTVVYLALKELYAQYQASEPILRMKILAQFINSGHYDVIALQETQVMNMGDTVSFSFVDNLIESMRTQGSTVQWQQVRQTLNRMNLNVRGPEGDRMKLDFWEGNVLLVREGVSIVDSSTAEFPNKVNFNILSAPIGSTRGYVQATLQTSNGKLWQIFNTHLEVELLGMVNVMQGQSMNAATWNAWQTLDTNAVQILVGDLNSVEGKGGMVTLTSDTTGLVDLWNLQAGNVNSSDGFTCCIENVQGASQYYNRRIDYVLARNIRNDSRVNRISLLDGQAWGSDHALLSAVIKQ